MKQHIIYLPGLGDRYDVLRRLALLLWRRPNVTVTLVSMRWLDPDESYVEKIERIRQALYTYEDRQVTVVGESAGGTMALAVLRRFYSKVDSVVTIAGMNHGAGSVSRRLYAKNAAFETAMDESDKIVATLTDNERQKLITVYSSHDFVVPPKNTLLPGVTRLDLKTPGHMATITSVLLWHYRRLLRR